MTDASTSENMSPELSKVVQRAKREPAAQFHSLAHLIDESALAGAYGRMRKDAAVGVDGVTKEQYGQDLENNLRDLHERLKAKRYRHQPIRRVHIPKDGGKTRAPRAIQAQKVAGRESSRRVGVGRKKGGERWRTRKARGSPLGAEVEPNSEAPGRSPRSRCRTRRAQGRGLAARTLRNQRANGSSS